jgi:hypothetical protein
MAPDIPSLQSVEVHDMVREHYEAALQGPPFLPLLSLASFSLHGFNLKINLFPIYSNFHYLYKTFCNNPIIEVFQQHALWLLCPFFHAMQHQS